MATGLTNAPGKTGNHRTGHSNDLERERVFDLFRHWGYLEADLDPLSFFQPVLHPELQIDTDVAQEARRVYCASVGLEFMHTDLGRGKLPTVVTEKRGSPIA